MRKLHWMVGLMGLLAAGPAEGSAQAGVGSDLGGGFRSFAPGRGRVPAPTPPPGGAPESRTFHVTPYLWASGLNGEVGVLDRTVDVDLGFADIVENLDGAAMLVRGRGLPRLVIPGVRDIRGYRAMYRDFTRAIREGTTPEMSLERAMADQALMDQVYASLAQPA